MINYIQDFIMLKYVYKLTEHSSKYIRNQMATL